MSSQEQNLTILGQLVKSIPRKLIEGRLWTSGLRMDKTTLSYIFILNINRNR